MRKVIQILGVLSDLATWDRTQRLFFVSSEGSLKCKHSHTAIHVEHVAIVVSFLLLFFFHRRCALGP